jgi:peptide chain release factor 1
MNQKIILEIRAGTGGDEAALFAGDLARMYQKYAAKKGWRFSVLDFNQTSLYGYKNFIAELEGENVYNALKNESGVHRIQRIPKTEKAGRIHTSTASVAVLSEVEAKNIKINPADLEISFFRSSGPGGQNVQKVESAVRILHKPTGIVVSSQVERSQARNRERAMNVLIAKLYEKQQLEAAAKLGAERRTQIGTAERAEKIRTYNFSDDRITDHRFNVKVHNIEKVLEGDLDTLLKKIESRK